MTAIDDTRTPGTEAIPYPFRWTPPMEVPEALKGLREHPLVTVRLPSGDTALLVTRYADVRSLFADPRLSKNIARPEVARITKDNDLFVDPGIDGDPPHHSRMRGLVTRAFTARRIETLRPYAQQVTDELLDAVEAGPNPAELNEALAFPLPILVICKLLGIPPEDRNRFRRLVDGFLSVTKLPPAEVEECRAGLWQYLVELVEYKRANPGEDDLITALIKIRDEDDTRLSDYELHHWTRSLLIAGYVTTASQIGTGTAVLLHRQDLLKQVQADWSLVPGAVEELLRTQIMGSSIGTMRYALVDIPLADGTILPEGSSVLLSEEPANMDETVFDDPFTLDVRRSENHHMTFGAGIHYCVGAALARMELQVATETLLRRFPNIRLAVPAGQLPRAIGGFMEGFSEVPGHVVRTALVTGANRGIGLAVARELHARGLRVLVAARTEDDGNQAAASIGPDVTPLVLDVTDPASVAAAAAAAGPVDVLVSNAGVLLDGRTDPLTVDLGLVSRTLEVNLLGTWRVLQAFVPGMLERGWGRVVVVSSGTTAEFGGELFAAAPGYSLSKSGLNGLTTMVAGQTAGRGVLVNAINPGRVKTRMMPHMSTPPDEVAGFVADVATLPDDGPHGQFLTARQLSHT